MASASKVMTMREPTVPGGGLVTGLTGLSVNRPHARGVKPETLHNPSLASRVRKARTESICPKCHYPVGTGVLIGLVPGTGWCHVRPCITGGKAPMIGPSNEPHPDDRPDQPGGSKEGRNAMTDLTDLIEGKWDACPDARQWPPYHTAACYQIEEHPCPTCTAPVSQTRLACRPDRHPKLSCATCRLRCPTAPAKPEPATDTTTASFTRQHAVVEAVPGRRSPRRRPMRDNCYSAWAIQAQASVLTLNARAAVRSPQQAGRPPHTRKARPCRVPACWPANTISSLVRFVHPGTLTV